VALRRGGLARPWRDAFIGSAAGANVWELRGAIVTVTEEQLAIRHKPGQVVDLVMDYRTVVLHDELPQGREALRPAQEALDPDDTPNEWAHVDTATWHRRPSKARKAP